MQVLIMPNLEKAHAAECTRKAVAVLTRCGVSVVMEEAMRRFFGEEPVHFGKACELAPDSSFLVAVGGDGTILHSSQYAVEYDIPLLGINLGRLGFMAGLEVGELPLLRRLVEGDYREERRMLLHCRLESVRGHSQYIALNDVVISKGALSRMVELNVECDGHSVMDYRADGLILSTPTGSTAYSLSAGGPIIEPSIECISLTPICPHSLASRSVIFSAEKVVSVRPAAINQNPIYMTIDGAQGTKLEKGDLLVVRRSEKSLRLIDLTGQGYFDILKRKFEIHSLN